MKFNKSGITINNKEENLPIKAYGIKPRPNAVNESGGLAYKKSPEHVLLNILFNSKVTAAFSFHDHQAMIQRNRGHILQ